MSDSKSVASAASKFSAFGHLDVLINNAGIYPDEGISILTIPREQMVSTFQTNTFGALEMTQPSYCLSKLALNGLSIMLAEALKEHGIAVNLMCPGWGRTDMGGSTAPRSVEEGADTAVWLAAEADQKLTGRFFRDRKEIGW